MKRNLGVIVLAACSLLFAVGPATGGPNAANAPSLLTPDEAKEVDAVIKSMLAAGFPDARKSTVYSGKLAVSATFDPDKAGPPLPSTASNVQMTVPNSTKMTYGYVFGGLHFKLADGSWIISLQYRFTPGPGDSVNAADATELKLATLTADAAAAQPFDAEKSAARYLDQVAPAQRRRSVAVLSRYVPLTMFLKLNPDAMVPAAVLLDSAGWADAADLSLIMADQRSRNYWQLKPWITPEPAFDPTGAYPKSREEEENWKKAHAQLVAEPPQVALRRALFRWCRAEIMVEQPEDAMLPLPVAAAAAKAAVDPGDPQQHGARIDALAAGAKLPVSAAKDAPLAARLQSWEGRPRRPRMSVTGSNAGGGVGISTAFAAPVSAYTPDKADLDALVALLADHRPSRFNDFSGPRTVCDNAWRALAVLLQADPRTLAGYPTDNAWTAAERKVAAKAFQAWWKDHRKEFVEK